MKAFNYYAPTEIISDAAEFRKLINNCPIWKESFAGNCTGIPEVKELYEKVKKSLRENGVEVVHLTVLFQIPPLML